jgi:hypothetical protein
LLDSNEWSTLPVRLRDANAAERVLQGDKEVVWDLLNFLFRHHHPNIKLDGNDSSDTDVVPSEVDTITSCSDGDNVPVKESPKPKRRPFSATRKPSKEHSFLEHSAVMEELLLRREILGTPRSVTQPRVPPLGFIASGTGTGKADNENENENEMNSNLVIIAQSQIETEVATKSKTSRSSSSNSNSNTSSSSSCSSSSSRSSRCGSGSISSKKPSSPLLGLKDRILANKKAEEEKNVPLNSTEASFSASDLSESTRNSTNDFNLLDSDGHIEENKTMKIFEIRKAYGRTLSRPWTSVPRRLKISPISSPNGGGVRTGLLGRGGTSSASSPKGGRTGPSPVSSPKGGRTGPSPVSSPKGGRTGPSPVSSPKGGRTGPSPVSSPKGGRTGPSPVSSPNGGRTRLSPVSSPKGGRLGSLGKGSTSLVCSSAGLGGNDDVDSALNDCDSLDGSEGVQMITERNGSGADREAMQGKREKDRDKDSDRDREKDRQRVREGEGEGYVFFDSDISYGRNIAEVTDTDAGMRGDEFSYGYSRDDHGSSNYDDRDGDDDELLYDDRSFVKNGDGGGDDRNVSEEGGEEKGEEDGGEGEEGVREEADGQGEKEEGEGDREGDGDGGSEGEAEQEGEGEGISTLSDNVSFTDSVPTSDNITEYSDRDRYRVRRHGRDVRGSTYIQNIRNTNIMNNINNGNNNIPHNDDNKNSKKNINSDNNDNINVNININTNDDNNDFNAHSPSRTNDQQKRFQKPKTVGSTEKQKFTDLNALNPGPTFLRHVDCITGGSHERAGLPPSNSNDSRTFKSKWPTDTVSIPKGNSQNNSDIPKNVPNNVPGNIERNDSNDIPRNSRENIILENNRKRNPEKRMNRTFSKDLRNILLNNNGNTVECSTTLSGASGSEGNSETDLKNSDSVSRISSKSNSTPVVIPQGNLGGEKMIGREKEKLEVQKQKSMREQRKDGREDGKMGAKEGEKEGDVSEIEKEKESVFSWLCGLGVQAAKVGNPPNDFNTYDTAGSRGQNPNLGVPGVPVESMVPDLRNEWQNGVLLCELCAVLRPLQKDENKRVVTYDRRGHKVSSRLVLTGSETSVRSKAQVAATVTSCDFTVDLILVFVFIFVSVLLVVFLLVSMPQQQVFLSLLHSCNRFCSRSYFCPNACSCHHTPPVLLHSLPFLSSSSSPPRLSSLSLFSVPALSFLPFSSLSLLSSPPLLLCSPLLPLGTPQSPARSEQSPAYQRPREHS